MKKVVVVIVSVLAVVTAQATVINVDRDQLGPLADCAVDSGKGVSLHLLVDSDSKVSKDSSISVSPVYTEDRVWQGNDPVMNANVITKQTCSNIGIGDSANEFGDFILPQHDLLEPSSLGKDCEKYSDTALLPDQDHSGGFDKDAILSFSGGQCGWNNSSGHKQDGSKADISAEEVVLNIVGQFSNSDSKKVSFSHLGTGRRSGKACGRDAGLDDNETLKVVLKSCGGNWGLDKSAQFAGKCYMKDDRWHGGNGGGHDDHYCEPGSQVPEPATLAIFAVASLCFMIKRKRLAGCRC